MRQVNPDSKVPGSASAWASSNKANRNTIIICDVEFEGPFFSSDEILPLPGIFCIVCVSNDEIELLEVDESHYLKDCLNSSEHGNNMLFYAENCSGVISAIVHYTSGLSPSERCDMKQALIRNLKSNPSSSHRSIRARI